MPDNYKPFDVVEIRFKGSRKEFFRNSNGLELYTGDPVVLESDMGYDVGHVSISGELVRLQLKKRGLREDSDLIRTITRKATERDMERYQEAKFREVKILERARTIALMLKLEMKLSDIEIQGDNKKVIFFYTAESRVDFRELIKRFAEEFKLRIEMRQIGYREEASRLGGIGSCGRELCCSTWLTDFKLVNTSAARYQNLSINMLKLSGQCGKLKCCLNYELDTYMEALDEFPKAKTVRLDTETGAAYMVKTDILKRLTWFVYEDKHNWICMPLETINEYLAMNARGEKAPELIGEYIEPKAEPEGQNASYMATDLASDDITRLDRKAPQKKRPAKKGRPGDGPDNRGPRPDNRGGNPRPNNNDRPNNPERGPRPDGNRNRPENRGPRPDGNRPDNRNNRPNNPNPGNPDNPNPNPERNNRPENRGPRPDGNRNRPDNRGPRPNNTNPGNPDNPNPERNNRPDNRGPRPDGNRNRPDNRNNNPESNGPKPE